MTEFQAFPKIPRLNRDIIITEKIDGSNAQVLIAEDGTVTAGSRNRMITPGKQTDNFGFAAWVQEREDVLREHLGVGRHFGEWWGSGIQRGYGLENGERYFSLFNVKRWGHLTSYFLHFYSTFDTDAQKDLGAAGVRVVPTLYDGMFNTKAIDLALSNLHLDGSAVVQRAPAEGIIIYHVAAGQLFKVTLENDEAPKGKG